MLVSSIAWQDKSDNDRKIRLFRLIERLTDWVKRVIINVWTGWMLGKTAKTVSPTRPLEVDAMPEAFMETFHPVRFTTGER